MHVALKPSLLFEPLSATTTSTTTKAKTTTTVTTTTKPDGTTKTATTTPVAETTKSTTPATTTSTEKTASSATASSASSQAPVVTTKTNAPAASIADTDIPNIDVEDSTRMPLEDAQKIFLPIIIIFTVIAIALAIGYFIKAGKTAVAQKHMIIFIGMCFEYVSSSIFCFSKLKGFLLRLKTQKSCCIGYFLNCNVGILWCLWPVIGETLEKVRRQFAQRKESYLERSFIIDLMFIERYLTSMTV